MVACLLVTIGGCSATNSPTVSKARFANGLTLASSGTFAWLMMDEPENVTLEFNRFRGMLDTLPTGCVVLRAKTVYTVPLWPNGTTVDTEGTIRSSAGVFRIGQKVDGSATEWRRHQLNAPSAVDDRCPVDKTIRYHPRLKTFDVNQYARVHDGLRVVGR